MADKNAPIRADQVEKGDSLLYGSLTKGIENATVTKIDTVIRDHAYQPLTPSGKMVVNGIAASSYVSIHDDAAKSIIDIVTVGLSEQTIFHWWLAPYRMVCMGVSSSFCENKGGIVPWLQFGLGLAKFGEKQYFVVQILGLAVVFFVLNVFMVAETPFSSRFRLVGMAVVAAAFTKMRRQIGGKK